mmetsp:Transcript_60990/g.158270  ORF Transcript_60990/g.158270 Transcript_60990/m.158270 type:complete len:277 (-) Transcript_60990:237-1067(-)
MPAASRVGASRAPSLPRTAAPLMRTSRWVTRRRWRPRRALALLGRSRSMSGALRRATIRASSISTVDLQGPDRTCSSAAVPTPPCPSSGSSRGPRRCGRCASTRASARRRTATRSCCGASGAPPTRRAGWACWRGCGSRRSSPTTSPTRSPRRGASCPARCRRRRATASSSGRTAARCLSPTSWSRSRAGSGLPWASRRPCCERWTPASRGSCPPGCSRPRASAASGWLPSCCPAARRPAARRRPSGCCRRCRGRPPWAAPLPASSPWAGRPSRSL